MQTRRWNSREEKLRVLSTPRTVLLTHPFGIYLKRGNSFHFFFRIAAITRRGVIGVSLTSAPIAERASRTALAIAAGGATAPPSPMPFIPYSVWGVGVWRWPILIAGISAAPGR